MVHSGTDVAYCHSDEKSEKGYILLKKSSFQHKVETQKQLMKRPTLHIQ